MKINFDDGNQEVVHVWEGVFVFACFAFGIVLWAAL
jgi:hypothetical protein